MPSRHQLWRGASRDLINPEAVPAAVEDSWDSPLSMAFAAGGWSAVAADDGLQHASEWLHPGHMSRAEAAARLAEAGMPEGGFVLRSAAGPGQYALAVCTGGVVLHHLIAKDTGAAVVSYRLNDVADGLCLGGTVDAAVRAVLLLDEVQTISPVYPRPGPCSNVFSL